MDLRRLLLVGLIGGLGAAGIQALPFGYPRTNPKATTELEWSSAETRQLFYRSCGDCHSNETKWPWYSRVAPASWIITDHVHAAREKFNVSDWSLATHSKVATKATRKIQESQMPPALYLRFHPSARLSQKEKQELIAGMELMKEFRPAP